MSKVTINCINCNKERVVYACQNIKTCSKECRYAVHSKKMTGNNNPAKRSEVRAKITQRLIGRKMPKGSDSKLWKSKEVKCAECDNSYFVSPARLTDGRGKYCSKECKNKGQKAILSKLNKGKKLSEETKQKIREATFRQFAEKGHPNLGKTWQMDETKKKNMARKGMWAKEKNPSWQGGISPFRQLLRNSDKYKEWRTSVFIRDSRQCVECGSRDEIQADHIYPFYKILDEENITNERQGFACGRLWDINNGRTLCVECHKKTPTWGRPALCTI